MKRLILSTAASSLCAVLVMNAYEQAHGFETIVGLLRSPFEVFWRGFGEFVVFMAGGLVAGSCIFIFRRKSKTNRGIASSVTAVALLMTIALVGIHHPDQPFEFVALRGTRAPTAF